MKKKIKFKGRLKSYMCWPLYLTFVWICADGIALRYDRRLGYGMVGFTVFYFALVLLLYVRSKSVVANELISFATQYSSVQKRLLNEFEVPYALLEYSGKILWVNDKFAELMGVDKNYHKSITTLFPTVTRELLTKSDAPTDFKIVNEEEDSIVRLSVKRIYFNSIAEENEIIDTNEADQFLTESSAFVSIIIVVAGCPAALISSKSASISTSPLWTFAPSSTFFSKPFPSMDTVSIPI